MESEAAAQEGAGALGWGRRLLDRFRRLRPEEALFIVGFVPSSIVTVWANWHLAQHGIASRKIQGGLLRLAITILLAAAVPLLEKYLSRKPARQSLLEAASFFRMILPFLLCIAVYTNLHDTVRFVNPHDIQDKLVAIEGWIFGGQPVVWAERYITPARTELFSFLYANFFLVAPSVVTILWFSGKRVQAREALLGIILCFYTGYLLYIIFPAAPPRLYLESLHYFRVDLHGWLITDFQKSLINMMPNHASRAAFPSLHAGVSCVSLYYAWRHCRWFFPILLTFVIGLLLSTVYLRHHYVVDLIAGAMLLPWIMWITPRFDRWWNRRAWRASPDSAAP